MCWNFRAQSVCIIVTREIKAWLLIYGEDAREGRGGDGSGLLDDQIKIRMTGRVEWLVCRGGTSCRDAQGVGILLQNPPLQKNYGMVDGSNPGGDTYHSYSIFGNLRDVIGCRCILYKTW